MPKYFAGFDVGGTKTLAVVISDAGELLLEQRVPRPRGPEETVTELIALAREVENESGVQIAALGVGIAGAISRAGSVQFSPNIPELVDFPLRDLLAERLDVPVVVDNDATAATWAEHQLGAARGVSDVLYVALGTGIGTGFVLDGKIYRGAHGFAGESGHMVINRDGATHISGVRGPWEMYASGNGLGALARSWAAEGKLKSVLTVAGAVASIRGEHVSVAVTANADDALALLDEFSVHVAVGMTNLMYVLDPARIVLGGGLVEIGEALRSRVQRAVDDLTLGGDFRPPVPVALAELGPQAGAIGAALLARGSGAPGSPNA